MMSLSAFGPRCLGNGVMFCLTWLLFVIGSSAASLPTISSVGTKFYDSNGKQFFVKGE
jgi:hypothetical protein